MKSPRSHLLTLGLVVLGALALPGCAQLAALLGPAATAAGTAYGAYESAVQAEAKKQGLPPDSPKVLAAVAQARALAEKRAAEDKSRDLAEQAKLDLVLAEMHAAAARPCPSSTPAAPPPVPAVLPMLVDAGADGAP